MDHHSPSIVTQSAKDKASIIDFSDFASMSIDELWKHRENIDAVLAVRITSELADLKKRLHLLNPESLPLKSAAGKVAKAIARKRRTYRSVFPKYRNPNQSSETWAGRGKKPRWLTAALKSGKRLDDFRI